ncbi:IS1/IS1595 family N-terminal zinc-binding domain-containing protein, partial [Mogibacterium sp.]
MKSVNCPYCGAKCIRHGKNSSGTQRWFCPECKSSFTPKIDNSSKQL